MRMTLKDIYEESISKDYPKRRFLDIAYDFNKYMANSLLEGEEIVLPSRLGSLFIAGRKIKPRLEDGKIKGLAPNWKATKELWERDPKAKEEKKLIYYFNEHSDGYRYRIIWSRRKSWFRNKFVYEFKLSRTNARLLSKMIQEGKTYRKNEDLH